VRATNATANATTDVFRLEHIPAASASGAAGLGSELSFYTVNATPYYYQGAGISHIQTNVGAGAEENALAFKTYSMANGGWKEAMRIQGGNVGIGTSNPLAQLNLTNGDDQGGAFSSAQIALGYHGTNQYSQWIVTRHNNAVTNNAIMFYTGDGTASGTYPTNAIFGMTVTNGKVGIGTTNPAAKLHIGNGDILLDNQRKLYFDGINAGAVDTNWGIGMDASANLNVFGAQYGTRGFTSRGRRRFRQRPVQGRIQWRVVRNGNPGCFLRCHHAQNRPERSQWRWGKTNRAR